MNWNELKEMIETMPESERKKPVRVLIDEYLEIKAIKLAKMKENLYYNPDWDGCLLEGWLVDDDFKDEKTELIIPEGEYILYND